MLRKILPIVGSVLVVALVLGTVFVWTAIFNRTPHEHSAPEQEAHKKELLEQEKAEATRAERDVDEINKNKYELFRSLLR